MAECVRERPKQRKKKKKKIQHKDDSIESLKSVTNDDIGNLSKSHETNQLEIKGPEAETLSNIDDDNFNLNASSEIQASIAKVETSEVRNDKISPREIRNKDEDCNSTEIVCSNTTAKNTVCTNTTIINAENMPNTSHFAESSAPFLSLEHEEVSGGIDSVATPQPSVRSRCQNEQDTADMLESSANLVSAATPQPSVRSRFQNEQETADMLKSSANLVSVATPQPSVRSRCENEQDTADMLESSANLVSVATPQPSVRPRSQVINNHQILNKPIAKASANPATLEKEVLAPFTEEQLNSFYYNQELQQIDYFVDEFLKNANREQLEFYELVLFYYKSRKRLGEILDKLESLQSRLVEDRGSSWVIKQNVYTAEGECACGVKVSQQQNYQQAFFKDEVKKSISQNLFRVRGIAHETLPLELYNSQVARLRIEDYLSKLFKMSSVLLSLESSAKVSAALPSDLDQPLIQVLVQIQDCITVLFVFKRYGILEVKFGEDVDAWLSTLVGVLQRVGTLPDSFFLLNHLLRCPPSTAMKISNFLQFPLFNDSSVIRKWNSPLVHHFVVMLATLTLPVRSREEFLQKFQIHSMHIEANKINRSISWTLVDEEKEEDEDLEKSWSLMTESDLIAVFEQFPFTQLLIYLLDIQNQDGEDTLVYTPSKSTSSDMMSLFAFSTCLIKLLSKIFDTYNLVRYRQFLKCVSRIIRLVTQVVSDHWLSYRSYRMDIIGDEMESIPAENQSRLPAFALTRLQVEFDQLFIIATKRILCSHSAGAIQFLSTMPFEAVQPQTMWIILYLALDQHTDIDTLVKIAGPANLPSVKNLDISPSEGIFLLTALSNMAIARCGEEEKELVNSIAILIVEISFSNVSLNGLYMKNGKDLLATICQKHAFVMTALLNHVNAVQDALNPHLTFLFNRLPLSNWIPTIKDLEKIRKWLLNSPVTSEENKMTRIILGGLNYSTQQNSSRLFLPRSYHYIIALMIVEAYGISFPDYPGGIPKLNQKDANFITQMGKLAVSSFTKLMQSKVHAEYLAWGWEVLLKLKLHESQALGDDGDYDERMTNQIMNEAETWCANSIKTLLNKRPFEFHIEETPQLLNVNQALKTNGLYASYIAFCLTKDGHFVDLIMSNGLRYMNLLKDWCQYDALLSILHAIVPVFHNTPEKLICDNFLQILNKLVHIDVDKAGYTEKIWQYFIAGTYSQKLSALIISQIFQAKKHSEARAQSYILFWMDVFLAIPMWHRDCGILFQLDRLCEVAFTIPSGITVIENCLYDEHKKIIKSSEPRGILSSVMSWLSSQHYISFLPNNTEDFCYYAYVILRMEKRFEDEIGVWREMSTEMIYNPMMTTDDAYKKSLSNVKSLYIPPLASLSIYRWGEQAIATPNDHPLLPIIWQQFFLLFLRKPEQESGLPNRTGIGMRFFNTPSLSSFAKKMKNNLQKTASYHQEKSTVEEDVARRRNTISKEYYYDKEFHMELSKLYQSFSLWLEESRLHDANLYLDSLPEVYNPNLLLRVFQGNKDIWFEYVSEEGLQKKLKTISSIWSPLKVTSENDDIDLETTSYTSSRKRIIKRLSSEGSPRPPPDIVRINTPVEEITLHVILTQPRLFQEINNDLNQIVQYAKVSSSLQASHVGLDNEFLEMLPDLYEMVNTRMLLHIPCEGKLRKGVCKAPAKVTINFEELRLRERVSRLLDDNRSAFEQLLQNCRSSFPYDFCINTVHVDNIIEKLSHVYQTLDSTHQMEVQQSARKLFYLLAELIDNDVKRCYPAIQFFSSGIEVLGKAYIADNPSEQMSLLETIINHTSSVMFLAPHFYPMSCNIEHFVELYSKMVSYIEKELFTVIFVLLSKFDVSSWLTQDPPHACTASLLTNVIKAAGNIGREPDTEGFVILELVRNHFVTLLRSDLNGLYSVALSEILSLSATGNISIYIWNDFLATMDWKEEVEFDKEGVLNIDHIKESIHYMASYFMYARESVNGEMEVMYKTWEPYIASLCIVLKNSFSRSIVHSCYNPGERTTEAVIKELWGNLLSVYQPWLVPQSSGKIWTLLRAEKVQIMVQSFGEMIRTIVDMCAGENNGYCFILNDLLNFYASTILMNIKEEQSLEIFNSHFATLPWQQYCPSIQELTYATQVYGAASSTFAFYSTIFLQVDWLTVCASYINSGNSNVINRFNHVLLHVVLMFTTSNKLTQSLFPQLKELLTNLVDHNWSALVLEDLGRICQWYSQNVEAALLLQNESIVWLTLKFLKPICGFVRNEDSQNIPIEFQAAKRNMYVQIVATLITRCASHKNQVYQFQLIMGKLLGEIELILGLDNPTPMQELVTHCATCLTIQNSIATGPVSNAIKTAISSHLLSTSCSMIVLAFISSASRCLASIHDMVELLENAISCHFVRLNDQELVNSWIPVMNSFVIPELSKDDFVNEALKQNALLTLYSYNLSRISHVTSHAEQLDILIDCVTWCSKPQLEKDSEAKILLLWLQIFDIVRVQSAQHKLTNEQWKMVAKYMMFLSASTQNQGEDKTYSGVLGVIGIGRRSGLSKEFRLTAKATHLFLVSQLPSSLIPIRTNPDSPGAIRNSTNRTARATQEAEKAFTAFQGLLKNKNYQGEKVHIQWVIDYVSNPRINISDGCGLVAYLCQQFFYKQNFIGATIS